MVVCEWWYVRVVVSEIGGILQCWYLRVVVSEIGGI